MLEAFTYTPKLVVRRIELLERVLVDPVRKAKPMPAWMTALSGIQGDMGVGPTTVPARSTRSKDAQESDPVALAFNCTQPQPPTPTPLLTAPNAISPPD